MIPHFSSYLEDQTLDPSQIATVQALTARCAFWEHQGLGLPRWVRCIYGHFFTWGYPHMDVLFNGKSMNIQFFYGWLWGTHILGDLYCQTEPYRVGGWRMGNQGTFEVQKWTKWEHITQTPDIQEQDHSRNPPLEEFQWGSTENNCDDYLTLAIIDVLFPLVGWFIEGFEQPPLTTGKWW